jgi:hypothetical protein
LIWNKRYFDRGVLLVLIALEALLFFNFFSREIASYPPLYSDQTVYLTQAYGLEERVFSKGLSQLWEALWHNGSPAGLLLPIEGAFAGLLLGGTRMPQLAVLFIAFSALQVVVFATARVVWDRRAHGYMALGLILCQTTGWFWAGGLFDFRTDFVAYCLYGIWVCAALRSQLFLDRRWAIGCGLLGAFLVLHRFLTIIYLLGVCIGFALACVIIPIFAGGDADLVKRLRQRLYNVLLSVAILVLAVSPILLINWKAIFAYYFVNTSGWARQAGINDLAGHLFYYPNSILNDHWGPTFLWASGLAIAIGLLTRLLGPLRTVELREGSRRDGVFLLQVIFLLGAVLGPMLVLTVDITKSPVVGGIVGVPAALLVVAVSAAPTAKLRDLASLPVRKLIGACSLLIFGVGLITQLDHASRHAAEYAQRRDLKQLAKIDKWLVQYAREHNWRNPRISFDVISDFFNSSAITASGFEQTGELVEFRPMLGGTIMGVDRREALSLLANSDFVILTTLEKRGVFPFYEHVSRYWEELKAWADQNMIVARTVSLDNFNAVVYARPTATISGVSGDWITSSGLTIDAPHDALQRFPRIRLYGAANYSWLPRIPTVSASVESSEMQLVPALLRRVDNSYEIIIDFSQRNLPPSDPVKIRLNFDTFFVPKKIGLNGDSRELVVSAPTLVQLIPTATSEPSSKGTD